MKQMHGGDVYSEEGMLDFSANINPLGPREAVVEAMKESLACVGQYPDVRCLALCNAIGQTERILPEYILCGNGAADLIFSAVYAQKPRKALLVSPSFSEYERALRAVGCEIVYWDLKASEGFALTEAYLSKLTEDLDMLFLCSPNNPVGNVIERGLLKRVLDYCTKYHIRMVVDECFLDFLKEPEMYTMKPYLQEPSLVILKAFTKMHALPGARLGYLMTCDQAYLQQIENMRQPWSVSVMAQAGGIAALSYPERIRETRDYIHKESGYLCAQLHKLGIRWYKPEANYILLWQELDLYTRLKQKHILIRDCSNYRGLSKGYYRIAVRLHEENQRLIAALQAILEEGRI